MSGFNHSRMQNLAAAKMVVEVSVFRSLENTSLLIGVRQSLIEKRLPGIPFRLRADNLGTWHRLESHSGCANLEEHHWKTVRVTAIESIGTLMNCLYFLSCKMNEEGCVSQHD